MDEVKKEQIAKLAADACEKRMRYDALSMRNVPTDPDERKKLAAEYAIAHAEVLAADYLLECAKDPKPNLEHALAQRISGADGELVEALCPNDSSRR